jgi:hypothetical protein
MPPKEIFEAIRGFFSVLDGASALEDRRAALRLALDRLTLAYHYADVPSDEREHREPGRSEFGDVRQPISAAFPELDTPPDAANAIDHLTHIAMDLREVLGRAEESEDDALFHFRLLFESHWGHHLRALQALLHEHEFR